eukprot:gene4282-7618_t
MSNKFKLQDQYSFKKQQKFNEKIEIDHFKIKEHFSKLKFNFRELDSKNYFLNELATLDPECVDFEQIQQNFEEKHSQKKQNYQTKKEEYKSLKEKVTNTLENLNQINQSINEKKKLYEEKFEVCDSLMNKFDIQKDKLEHSSLNFEEMEQKITQQEMEKVKILKDISNVQDQIKEKSIPKKLQQEEQFLKNFNKVLGFMHSIKVEDITCSNNRYRALITIQTNFNSKKIEKTFALLFKPDEKITLLNIEFDSKDERINSISEHAIKLNDLGFFVREIHGYNYEKLI